MWNLLPIDIVKMFFVIQEMSEYTWFFEFLVNVKFTFD